MTFTNEEKNLLLDLFHIYAPSKGEKELLDFIVSILSKNNIPYQQDDNGNIYCLNHMNEPLLSAHTDCVGTAESGAYVNLIDLYPYENDEILKGIGNIGGDDKCGVFLILLYLLSGKPINAVFSVEEEIGGFNGITHLLNVIKDNEVFKSIPYCLVLDRKNPGDIICNKNSYGSKDFEAALYKIGKDYGYEPVLGGSSDANKIKDYMNCCNLSVSYYNPHSSTEFVSMNDLYNTWLYVQDIIKNLPRDIPLEKTVYTPSPSTTTYNQKTTCYGGKYGCRNGYNGKYDDDYYNYGWYD